MTTEEKLARAIKGLRQVYHEATNKKGGPEKSGGCSTTYIWRVANQALLDLGLPHDSAYDDYLASHGDAVDLR